MIAAIIGAGFAWLLLAFLTAPEGYQDATGFHRGRPSGAADQGLSAHFHSSEVDHD